MAKIILGKRPKSFKRTLKVALPEGEEGSIELSFRYRTRTEYGSFVDALLQAAKVTPASAAAEDVEFSLAQALELTRDTNADYIMQIVDGWNLDVDFSRAAVVQMCDELPGVALAIINDYRAAITEGRLGN
jgi:hypothetical protein